MALSARARPFRGTRKHGLVLVRDFVRDSSLALECKPSRIGSTALGQPLAVGCSLRVKPRWLGPPPSTRVLLLLPRLLSLASFLSD